MTSLSSRKVLVRAGADQGAALLAGFEHVTKAGWAANLQHFHRSEGKLGGY
jgi:hypothetical protein